MCDTNGGTLPHEIQEIVTMLQSQITRSQLGIHTHNDCELAVANSLSAVQAGARQVQGTINGYGERCGNANLCSVIPNLQLKLGYDCLDTEKLNQLHNTARFVSEVANVNMPVNQPYVGNAAFAHKGASTCQPFCATRELMSTSLLNSWGTSNGSWSPNWPGKAT